MPAHPENHHHPEPSSRPATLPTPNNGKENKAAQENLLSLSYDSVLEVSQYKQHKRHKCGTYFCPMPAQAPSTRSSNPFTVSSALPARARRQLRKGQAETCPSKAARITRYYYFCRALHRSEQKLLSSSLLQENLYSASS